MDYEASFNYADFEGLGQLRRGAGRGEKGAIDAAAKQFEALFIQMMMKSMRDASFGESLFDGPGMDMYRDLMDKELSLDLASHGGIGLADSIRRFLDPASALPPRQQQGVDEYQAGAGAIPNAVPETLQALAARGISVDSGKQASATASASAAATLPRAQIVQAEASDIEEPLAFNGDMESFVQALAEPAERVGRQLGVHPMALIAQAALETGWGRHVIADGAGEKSWNLFGIKARAGQPAVQAETREFRDGQMQTERAQFRWFDSMEEAFDGYASLIGDSPRYRQAVANGQNPERYAEELQRAGYATDPDYASKIIDILRRPGLAEMWRNGMPGSSFSLPGR